MAVFSAKKVREQVDTVEQFRSQLESTWDLSFGEVQIDLQVDLPAKRKS